MPLTLAVAFLFSLLNTLTKQKDCKKYCTYVCSSYAIFCSWIYAFFQACVQHYVILYLMSSFSVLHYFHFARKERKKKWVPPDRRLVSRTLVGGPDKTDKRKDAPSLFQFLFQWLIEPVSCIITVLIDFNPIRKERLAFKVLKKSYSGKR